MRETKNPTGRIIEVFGDGCFIVSGAGFLLFLLLLLVVVSQGSVGEMTKVENMHQWVHGL